MKRGGQLTLSLGGTMRLVPASRSPLAVRKFAIVP